MVKMGQINDFVQILGLKTPISVDRNFEHLTSEGSDRDLVVLLATEAGHRPTLVVEKSENSTAVLLTLVPRLQDLVKVASEVVFLIDCSGSMRGQSISMAREAVSILLNSLPTDSTFNIFRFGSTMEQLFPFSQAYTDSTLEDARALTRNMNANLGGTEILTPLQAILNQSQQDGGRPKQLFVITDGGVSNSEQCIQLVKSERKSTRVFTLGIGSSADRHLVKGLARAGGGTAAFTRTGEPLARKVVGQLKQALAPSLHPFFVDWGGLEVKSDEFCQVPRILPSIFNGSSLSLFRLFEGHVKVGEGKVALTAGHIREELGIEREPTLTGELLHKMFARKMIQELEEDAHVGRNEKELIKDLSVKYGILSKFTSFVGVDEATAKEVGEMVVRQVDNMMPTNQVDMRSMSLGVTMMKMRSVMKCSIAEELCMKKAKTNTSKGHESSLFEEMARKKRSKDRLVTSTRSGPPPPPPPSSAPYNTSFDAIESGKPQHMLGRTCKSAVDANAKRTKSAREKMKALLTLQTASGHFQEDKIIGDFIGRPLGDLKASAPDSKPESIQDWITALVIAFLELECLEEKDLWEMSVDKAKEITRDATLLQAAKLLVGRI